mgnify:CR=1 FL=1
MTEKSKPVSAVNAHIGSRVKMRREFLRLSQEKLGSQLDVSFQQVQKYENGKNRISVEQLLDIARILDTDPGFFYAGLADAGAQSGFSERQSAIYPEDSREGHELHTAFMRIKSKKVRRNIVDLVKAVADGAKS